MKLAATILGSLLLASSAFAGELSDTLEQIEQDLAEANHQRAIESYNHFLEQQQQRINQINQQDEKIQQEIVEDLIEAGDFETLHAYLKALRHDE